MAACGAENRATASDQHVPQADLNITVRGQPSMIAQCGLSARLPDARSRAEPARAARPLQRRQGHRDSDAAPRGRGPAPHQRPASGELAPRRRRPGVAWRKPATTNCSRVTRMRSPTMPPNSGSPSAAIASERSASRATTSHSDRPLGPGCSCVARGTTRRTIERDANDAVPMAGPCATPTGSGRLGPVVVTDHGRSSTSVSNPNEGGRG